MLIKFLKIRLIRLDDVDFDFSAKVEKERVRFFFFKP